MYITLIFLIAAVWRIYKSAKENNRKISTAVGFTIIIFLSTSFLSELILYFLLGFTDFGRYFHSQRNVFIFIKAISLITSFIAVWLFVEKNFSKTKISDYTELPSHPSNFN